MPRDPSGNYTLPALGNPAVTNTPITIAWWNGTSTDMAAAFTDSLSRTGLGGMLGPFGAVDGTAGAPGLTFQSELNTGFYRPGPGDMEVVVQGTRLNRWTAAGFLQATFDNGATWKNLVYTGVAAQSMGATGALDFDAGNLTIAGVAVRTTTAASVSSSSGSYTTSFTTFTTVTNLSISWTSTGGRAVISLQPNDSLLVSSFVSNNAATGTLKLGTGGHNYQFDVTSASGNVSPGAFWAVTPVLTAGAYTINCQVKTALGGTFTVSNCELSVYEI